MNKIWLKANGNEMCEEERNHEICNHDKGNQHPKDQEDLTMKSPEYEDSNEYLKNEDPWEWISLGDVSICV